MTSSVRFGTDGWRGVIAEEFTFAAVRRVAWALADELHARIADSGQRPVLVVGYDTRFNSSGFANAVAEVLTACDVHVYLSTSPVPSQVISHAIVDREAHGGVMVTASHNPARFNGLKIKGRSGAPASFDFIHALEARIDELAARGGEPPRTPLDTAEDDGNLDRIAPLPDYLTRLAQLVDLPSLRNAGLTIVVDAMYGTGAGILAKLLAEGTTKVIEINTTVNPAFPGIRGPEPIAANLTRLSRVVQDGDSSLGLAFDGDADRIGVVGPNGQFVNAQLIFGVLALYLLETRGWSGPLVKSTNATSMIDRLGQDFGVPVYTTPVGFTAMAPLMREHDAIIAGEETGGFAFRHHIPDRDGVLSALFLLDLLVRRDINLDQALESLRARVGEWHYERVDVSCSLDRCDEVMLKVRAAAPKRLAGVAIARALDADGQKYILEDGSWLLVRFSGTEPVLRFYAEAGTPDRVQELLARGRELAGV